MFENFSMAFLEGGLFFPFAILSLPRYKDRSFIFAVAWFILASISSLFFMDHVEPRRLCWNAIPLAILAFIGFRNMLEEIENKSLSISKNKIKIVFALALISSIMIGNYILIGLLPDKTDEKAYSRLLEKIDNQYSDAIILVPSGCPDYSFLNFSFPNRKICCVEGDRNKDLLKTFSNGNILYVCWEINKDLRIYRYEKSNYNDSWIVNNPNLKLKKVIEEGDIKRIRYVAYLVYNVGFGNSNLVEIPMEGGTKNFDVSVSPYILRAGHYENETVVWDVEREVSVPEEAVMEGKTIRVEE